MLLNLYEQDTKHLICINLWMFGELPMPQPGPVPDDCEAVIRAVKWMTPLAEAWVRDEIKDVAALNQMKKDKMISDPPPITKCPYKTFRNAAERQKAERETTNAKEDVNQEGSTTPAKTRVIREEPAGGRDNEAAEKRGRPRKVVKAEVVDPVKTEDDQTDDADSKGKPNWGPLATRMRLRRGRGRGRGRGRSKGNGEVKQESSGTTPTSGDAAVLKKPAAATAQKKPASKEEPSPSDDEDDELGESMESEDSDVKSNAGEKTEESVGNTGGTSSTASGSSRSSPSSSRFEFSEMPISFDELCM